MSNEKSLSENEAQAGGIPGKFFRSDFSKPAEKDGAVQDRRRGGKDMNWTDEQREAITVRGSDILVSAAAGSGKTAVLTERIKQLILRDGISVDEMLVVTFSNAAAAEMKEKILKSIGQEIRGLTGGGERQELTAEQKEENRRKAEFLRVQLRKAHTADISTFHKFSMNIIRRYFYLTDIDADFSICDESRRQILQAEALEELMDERFASGGEDFTEFLRNYSGVRSEERVREMILSVYRFIMSMPDPFQWLRDACAALGAGEEEFRRSPVWQYIADRMRRSVEEAGELAEKVCELTEHLPSIVSKAQKDREQISALLRSMEEEFSAEAVFKGIENVRFQRFTASKDDKEDFAEIKDLVKKVRDQMKKSLEDVRKNFFPIPEAEMLARMNATKEPAEYLCGLTEEFHRRFSEKKREKNLVDFNDIEHIALKILRHPEAAEEYQRHFKAIFVDEYQDSSILQETLIQRISRGDNVYMVGDVKQSIYKFRLAEPEIFIGKYNSFAAGPRKEGVPEGEGRRIDLNRNFRCKGNIIRCVNGIFSHVMDRTRGGIDYDENAALKKGVRYEGELDRKVSLHLVDSSGIDETSDFEDIIDEEIAELEKTELEARIAAKIAAERIGQQIYDCKAEKIRTVGPSDIAVLLRGTRGVADIYAEALKREGIASYIDAGEGYFETMEIEVFMNLLRVIDNRRRDVPLISVLRSPIFGMTVSDLIGIRLAHPSGSYSEAFLDSEQPKSRAACEKLDRWRLKSKYMPLEDFLWMLMRESGYMEYASALPGGDRRAANLRALVDKAVAYSGSQGKGLFGFVRYVEALSRNKVATGQSSKGEGAQNTVRIMTIHKSKGLEFPVVIVGGLGRRFNRDKNTSSVIMQKDFGLGLRFADADHNCYAKTIVQNVIEMKKNEERLAEEMRILYVALTRAMDELVLTASMKDLEKELERFALGLRGNAGDAGCFLDWILPNLQEAGIELIRHDRRSMSGAIRQTEEEMESFRNRLERGFSGEGEREDLFRLISGRFSFRYPYDEDVFSKSKFTVSELNRMARGLQNGGKPEPAPGSGGPQLVSEIEETGVAGRELSDISPARRSEGEVSKEMQLSFLDLFHSPELLEGGDLSAALDEKIRLIQLAEKKGEEEDGAAGYAARSSGGSGNSSDSCESAVPSFLRGEAELTAAVRGTIMHKVMELIPFREDLQEPEVLKFVDSLVEKNILSRREAETVSAAQISAFFRTEIGKRACRADWLKREWPFTLKKRREELVSEAQDEAAAEMLNRELPPELLIQGIIDCCFADAQGIVIIDYKTDTVDWKRKEAAYEEIRRRYRNQISIYRDVVKKAFDTDKIEMKIFLMRTGEMIAL